jgi:hypothetical protein
MFVHGPSPIITMYYGYLILKVMFFPCVRWFMFLDKHERLLHAFLAMTEFEDQWLV